MRGGAGTALVGDGPTVAARINEYAALGIDSFVLSGYPHWKSVSGWRVAVPASGCRHPEIPQPQPLNPQGEAVAMILSPVKSRKAKEEMMATPVKKWLLRVARVLPVGIVAVSQLASSVGWLSTRHLPSPEDGDGVLDALRQRRTVAASGDQLPAGADWLFNWRIAGVDFGTD
ncbi:hypothetical protein ACLK1T_01685 [Escherichia coli]